VIAHEAEYSHCSQYADKTTQDPMLWYGIGILYDRYGSYDYAEEAFSQVMNIQPDFEKANEIYFRLGIIYKQQNKWVQSLEVRSGLVPTFDARS
jgi:lipoprotein NlpI